MARGHAPLFRARATKLPYGLPLPADAAQCNMALAQADRHPSPTSSARPRKSPRTAVWDFASETIDERTLECTDTGARLSSGRTMPREFHAPASISGIRRRLAPLMQNDRRKIELILTRFCVDARNSHFLLRGRTRHWAQLLFSADPRRLAARRMQWSPDLNAGFSRAKPQQSLSAGHPRSDLRLPVRQRRRPGPPDPHRSSTGCGADFGAQGSTTPWAAAP